MDESDGEIAAQGSIFVAATLDEAGGLHKVIPLVDGSNKLRNLSRIILIVAIDSDNPLIVVRQSKGVGNAQLCA